MKRTIVPVILLLLVAAIASFFFYQNEWKELFASSSKTQKHIQESRPKSTTPETVVSLSIFDLVEIMPEPKLSTDYFQKVLILLKKQRSGLLGCIQESDGNTAKLVIANLHINKKGIAKVRFTDSKKKKIKTTKSLQCINKLLVGLKFPFHPLDKLVHVKLPIQLEQRFL